MPAIEVMGWSKSQKRWYKRYRGKLYWVSPRTLKAEPTREGSRQAANNWWVKKQAEIDQKLGEAKKHPPDITWAYERAIENHRLFAKWHRREGDKKQAEKSEAIIEWLQEGLKSDNPPSPLTKWQEDPIWEDKEDTGLWLMWFERFKSLKREEEAETGAPKENSIRAHVDDYLRFRRTRVASGKNTLGTFDTYRGRLLTFRHWVDPFLPVESLNEALWERYYIYLAGQVEKGELSPSTMSACLGTAREFVRSRWERRFIELPRNLTSRALAMSAPLKQVETFTDDEVKTLLGAASEREKLYLLLMLNCGFYPVDCAMLKKTEYRNGRIVRKRTKTRNRSENVPTVDFLLWKTTDELLQKHQSDHPELVLLNRNGIALWRETEKEGKFNRNSNIKCNFFRLQQKTGIKKPLKLLRKTSASKLEQHKEFGRYAEEFLGEAPSSVAKRHYIKPSREQLDRAILWLGKQYGIK